MNHNAFWVRFVSAAATLLLIMGYNNTLILRTHADTIARLTAELETARLQLQLYQEEAEEAAAKGPYRDGRYEGIGLGFVNELVLTVTVQDGWIAAVQLTDVGREDIPYLEMAVSMLPAMVEQQTAQVDLVTGATFTSIGLRDAAENALKGATK